MVHLGNCMPHSFYQEPFCYFVVKGSRLKMFASMLFCIFLDILTRIVIASMSQNFCGRVFKTRVGKFQIEEFSFAC